MTQCTERGCRNLEWKCADCGRLASTATIANAPGYGEWIKCSERLPEFMESVLAFDGDSIFYAHRFNIGEIEHFWSKNLVDESGEFTHWMPLPEPPEGK